MSAPVLQLWRLWLPPLGLLSLFVTVGALAGVFGATALVALTLYAGQFSWLHRLVGEALHFAAVRRDGLTVYYSRSLLRAASIERLDPVIRGMCRMEWDNLANWFGSNAAMPKTVIAFQSAAEVSALFGQLCCGETLQRSKTIVVAFDVDLQHTLRHLFAAIIAREQRICLPQANVVGLTTYLASDDGHVRLAASTKTLLNADRRAIARMYEFGQAFRKMDSCHAELAGSFAEYLVATFGRVAYLRYLRGSNDWNCRRQFVADFGRSLEEAEVDWRESTLSASATMTPIDPSNELRSV